MNFKALSSSTRPSTSRGRLDKEMRGWNFVLWLLVVLLVLYLGNPEEWSAVDLDSLSGTRTIKWGQRATSMMRYFILPRRIHITEWGYPLVERFCRSCFGKMHEASRGRIAFIMCIVSCCKCLELRKDPLSLLQLIGGCATWPTTFWWTWAWRTSWCPASTPSSTSSSWRTGTL